MVAALELYFDRIAERRIRRLWDALELAAVSTLREHTHRRHRPHISLICADELDAERVAAAVEDVVLADPPALSLQVVGVFGRGVLWLGPVVTRQLLDLHAQVHARLAAAGVGGWREYLPGAWVPHCTLSMRAPSAALHRAVPLCLDVLPVDTVIADAAVADQGRGRYRPLGPPA